MIQNILKSMHTEFGRYLISVILGIGLASIFRKSCDARNCLVFNAPPFKDIKDSVYNHNGRCYRFEEKSVTCRPDIRKQVEFA